MENSGIPIGWFVSACAAAVAGILAWWGNNRYFAGRFDQWQLDVKERFERLNQRVEGIEEMKQQVRTLETETARNRDIKHDVIGMHKAFSVLTDLLRNKL